MKQVNYYACLRNFMKIYEELEIRIKFLKNILYSLKWWNNKTYILVMKQFQTVTVMDASCPRPESFTNGFNIDYWNTLIACTIGVICIGAIYPFYLFSRRMLNCFTASVQVMGGMMNTHPNDKPYHLMTNWLTKNIPEFKHCRFNSIPYEICRNSEYGELEREGETQVNTEPGFGTHFFSYNGHWIKLLREQTPQISYNFIPYESITLTTFYWNKSLLHEIMNDAIKLARKQDNSETTIFTSMHGDWYPFGKPQKNRPVSSVILPKGMEVNILGDIQDFLANQSWYVERGIPYRRGYLLHGPPGCGKSSLVKAIAGEIGYDICILSLSGANLSDDGLNELMNNAPAKCIILVEDIDAAFKSRDANFGKASSLAYEGYGSTLITFRGLLNALDGVASAERRLIFMTTNYVDRLDPALARPGRVDVKVLIDFPDSDQIKNMFAKFYPYSEKSNQNKFCDLVKSLNTKVSMAMLQGLFMVYKTSEKDALDHVAEYFDEQQVTQPIEEKTVQDQSEEDEDKDDEMMINFSLN